MTSAPLGESGDGGGVHRASGPDSALARFILLAKFLGVPADPGPIALDHGKPLVGHGLEDLARISKRLKILAKIRAAAPADLAKVPLPALTERRDGQEKQGLGGLIPTIEARPKSWPRIFFLQGFDEVQNRTHALGCVLPG